MQEFHEISKGGRDKFLNKNKIKKQKILNQNKQKQNIILLQNLIRNFLSLKQQKNKWIYQNSMQAQIFSINDLDLKILWILSSLDMQNSIFRQMVIDFWIVFSSELQKQNNTHINMTFLSKQATLLIVIIKKFPEQVHEKANIFETLSKCFYLFELKVSDSQFQYILNFLLKDCQKYEKIIQNIIFESNKWWSILIKKILTENMELVINLVWKYIKSNNHKKIQEILNVCYKQDNQSIQLQQKKVQIIHFGKVSQIYQSLSLIVTHFQHNLLIYIKFMNFLLKILEKKCQIKIQQKYSKFIRLISDDKEYQQFIQQKQEWIELKQILSLENLQTKNENMKQNFHSHQFFEKILNTIFFQLENQQEKSVLLYQAISLANSLMKYLAGDIQFQIQIEQGLRLFQLFSKQSIYKFSQNKIQNVNQRLCNEKFILFALTIVNKSLQESSDLYFMDKFKLQTKKQELRQIIKQKLLKILGVLLFLQKTPFPIPLIIRTTINLLQNLYNKIFRTNVMPTKIFQNQGFIQKLRKYDSLDAMSQQIKIFLQKFPFVFPVDLRMERFKLLIRQDKNKFIYSHQNNFDGENSKVVIRRGWQFIDAFDQLQNANLKKRFQITFVNQYGIKQQGLDAGGLTKQFLNRVLKTVLNPIYGMFIQNSQKQLFPHPIKAQLKDGKQIQYYQFIGKLLGKAIYENITLGPKFSGPFLNALVGKKNSFDDLRKIDPDLYKSLVYIKDMKQDASELFLTFMYEDHIRKTPILLKKNGHKIKVDNQNKKQYVHLLANYKVNRLLQYQCRYIKKGFSTIINKEFFTMFNYEQLNYLISGTGIIDVADMKSYTKVIGYNQNDENIIDFWSVVKQFTEQDKSKLLMFVTSCPRPSYLGFKDLSPPFTIIKSMSDNIQSLPISHTCSNILELPNYKNRQILKQKLKMAINSNSGFQFG